MKVSILITCYNSEKYIDKAIENVVNQKGKFDLEILVGDDGSNDNTQNLVNVWIEKYPHIISMYIMKREEKEKSGFRAARNRINLLKYATGDYIAYLDGDDQYICDTKIQNQIEALEKIENNYCSCCGHDIKLNYLNSGKLSDMIGKSMTEGSISLKKYWSKYYVHTNTILFRGALKEYVLQNSYLDQFNDNYITFLLLQKGSMYYIPKSMAIYNLTGDGIWTGNGKIYGYIRNLLALDAEIKVNPSLKKISFKRHLSDILYVFKKIKGTDFSEIDNLLPYITMDQSPVTYTIVQYSNLNLMWRFRRIKLYIWSKLKMLWILVSRIPVYCKRIVNKQGKQNE